MITTILYQPTKPLRFDVQLKEIETILPMSDGLLWVDILDPTPDEISILDSVFHFHHLAIEDCIFPQNNAKLNDYGNYFFIVLPSFSYGEEDTQINIRELDIFWAKNLVVTIHNGNLNCINLNISRIKHDTNILGKGSEFLVYSLIDGIINNYFQIIDKLDEEIDLISDDIIEERMEGLMERIFTTKKNILNARKAIGPQRNVIDLLIKMSSPIITDSGKFYFRDIYDHLLRLYDMLDTYREILVSSLEAYMSVVSNNLNKVIKTLTIIATIMMPPMLITSFYGMNVAIPEVKWGIWGYIFAVGMIILLTFGTYLFLKKRKLF